MTPVLFGSIAVTGLTVAFLHAALPTHWLPFVLAGRAQGWSRAKTLFVTLLAGLGHVLFTIVLGALITGLGLAIDARYETLLPWIASGLLITLGLYYLLRGDVHGHRHFGDAQHQSGQEACAPPRGRGDAAIIGSLMLVLTFSPCEAFLPVFAAGVPFGWMGFVWLSAVLLGATLSGMLLFTWFTLMGLARFRLEALEHYEGRIVGSILILLAVLLLVLELS